MAQVSHGGGYCVDQTVKVEEGLDVATRQHQHGNPIRFELERAWHIRRARARIGYLRNRLVRLNTDEDDMHS
jgi:hypothetical protein